MRTRKGVSRYDMAAELAGSGTAWTTYTVADGLVDEDVCSIAVGPDGALWFGTARGISRFDGTRYWGARTALLPSQNTVTIGHLSATCIVE